MSYIEDRKKIEGALLLKMRQDPEFEKALLADPGGTLKQLGFEIPSIKIDIMREKDGEFLLVIPEDLPEGEVGKLEMAMVSGGDLGSSLVDVFLTGITFGTVSLSTNDNMTKGAPKVNQINAFESLFKTIFSSAW